MAVKDHKQQESSAAAGALESWAEKAAAAEPWESWAEASAAAEAWEPEPAAAEACEPEPAAAQECLHEVMGDDDLLECSIHGVGYNEDCKECLAVLEMYADAVQRNKARYSSPHQRQMVMTMNIGRRSLIRGHNMRGR